MTSIPAKPLASGHLHLRRNNPTFPENSISPAMVAAVSSKASPFLGVSSASLSFESAVKKSPVMVRSRRRNGAVGVVATVAAPSWFESWKPEKTAAAPSLSDVIWPAAGAFAAMAVLGRVDKALATKGVSISVAPLGAVSAILFTSPSSPAARKYNMFVGQIGCAAIGVLALTVFGPGWLARSSALAASIAFMVLARANHPPAASLPLMFIDGAKFHQLNIWYAVFPGAAGCLILSLIQEVVCYLKKNFKF
ncbi:PREDICTED: uncharacterized protein LOC104821456 [Tarenaya hassleriana]|uniref:uncharacterized protein LOC104821456 n=1 Tax=Tarenaya hassleriana TaxID=28532 RepID=UPI00053C9112|nr:PREDICTED: uncharacterized protein LOC104821456 [Tarenaya hassleriana]